MALESGEFDFAGAFRLPLPKTFSGTPAGWMTGKNGIGTLSPLMQR